MRPLNLGTERPEKTGIYAGGVLGEADCLLIDRFELLDWWDRNSRGFHRLKNRIILIDRLVK